MCSKHLGGDQMRMISRSKVVIISLTVILPDVGEWTKVKVYAVQGKGNYYCPNYATIDFHIYPFVD